MTTDTTAILYLRAARSSDAAISEQRRLCTGYAHARGWPILDVIVDNGVGGVADSKGLKILRDRISGGEAQVVIATDLARLSRDPKRVQAFARFCQQHGADLRCATQTVNLDAILAPTDGADTFITALYDARETHS
ncbi:recombinase family protein [Roseivivax marinus]|uniref:recombinase family protein n=1 Tax=Roseivivax marinus TaxID=1379903 RepID=UPI00273E0E49|nr:recombinase family protein [Roseivivax marinus]